MDQFDLAQELNSRYTRQHIEDQLRRSRAKTSPLISLHCIDCGELIPLKRREAKPGCIRCVSCQQYFEQWGE